MPGLSTLTDDFTTKDTSKWTWGGTASVVSGQANFVPATTYANSIGTGTIYTLTGNAALVQVVQTSPTGTTGTLENWFEVDTGGGSPMINWRKLGANLFAAWRDANGTETHLATLTYSSATHAWWRIQESGGTTFWDTSTDGINWTQRASLLNPFTYGTALSVSIGAGYAGTESTPGTFIVDNFNLPPSASPHGITPPPLNWKARQRASNW